MLLILKIRNFSWGGKVKLGPNPTFLEESELEPLVVEELSPILIDN